MKEPFFSFKVTSWNLHTEVLRRILASLSVKEDAQYILKGHQQFL